ncbi:terpene synthase family metal binding domain-containing protein [Penicillium soppii]|uniref:terpene synthase family metal binding domain-containing protein n=1 Tax=Penicillium soppii TaxID=69789 RepID=UPI0025465833|nr:terpene synthase family metal binding domain-containing protein [Penicillium soppii]KAJ5881664.1 terpene synthase family metal binding domain-containing protein [Penicillium soppii]
MDRQLRVAGIFMLWIFLWDDEIDGAGTIVSQSESHASIYCQNSLEFARLVLGLGEIDSKQSNKHSRDLQNLSCPVPTMVYFQDASEVLRTALNLNQRNRLLKELCSYMAWTVKELVVRESGTITTPDQYMELRNWTSGIYPVIAIFEFISQVKIDESLMESDEMKTIWKETCYLCMLINDIHSFPKEMASGSTLNAIPILFHADETKDLTNVMFNLKESLALSVDRFDRARSKLSSQLTGTSSHPQVMQYIDTCRTTVTGLLTWSLSTQRYSLSRYSVDGRVVITL